MKKILICALAPLLAVAATAHAVPVRGLYEARVPVPDQSSDVREQALQQALEAVLVRVTGTRALAGAGPVLTRASQLVQGYGYETAGSDGLLLKAQFDPRAVDAALRQQGLPVWGPNRLPHQVWLALRDDGAARAVLDAGAVAERAPALLDAAETRGLPLVFPEMDATDRQLVNFGELWNGVTEGVRGAARRYGAQRLLVGRVGREAGRWLGRWTLLDADGLSEDWVTSAATLDEALSEGLHQLADREGRRFATQPGLDRELRLQVAGVRSLQDYGRALNYLRGLNPVRSAQIEAAQGDSIVFRLTVQGDPQTLGRMIESGRVLRKQEAGLFESANRYVLVD